MAPVYIGNENNQVRKVNSLYVGDSSNQARKISKAYIGDANNQARVFYSGRPPIRPTLNDYSWAEISYISKNNLTAEYSIAVGQMKQIHLLGTVASVTIDYTCWAPIVGINHNPTLEGNNLIHFQIGNNANSGVVTTNAIGIYDSTAFKMNFSNTPTSAGGWESSDMRVSILGNDIASPNNPKANSFISILPADLRAVMRPCTKYTDNVGNGTGNVLSNITATNDYMSLLAGYEIRRTEEINLYEYFSMGTTPLTIPYVAYPSNVTNNQRRRQRHNTTTYSSYHLRSPSSISPGQFASISNLGAFGGNASYVSAILTPLFFV